MIVHANAKLGLAGRRALVREIEGWCVVSGGGCAFRGVARDGASVVEALGEGRRAGAKLAGLSARPFQPSSPLAAAAFAGR
jgi:hypothetical protein